METSGRILLRLYFRAAMLGGAQLAVVCTTHALCDFTSRWLASTNPRWLTGNVRVGGRAIPDRLLGRHLHVAMEARVTH
jgi:hypothetical protein